MSLDTTNRTARGGRFEPIDGGRPVPDGVPTRATLTEPASDLAPTPPPTLDHASREDSETMVLAPDSDPSVPSQVARVIVGRYCLERELGRGGFGVVLLGYDRELHRQVAIKVARRTPGRGMDHLLDEGRKAAQLDHTNVVPVYDCGRFDDRTIFIVSKYVDGGSLARQLALRTLPIDEAVRIAGEVAEGLAHAHERGLIHRDLKPSNILLDAQGRAYVADFGLAMRAVDRTDLVCVEGSPLYMSPEQAVGKSRMVDRRTDVFSFGVILYEMLTGRRPFPGKTTAEFRHQVSHDEPPPPRAINPEIPEHLEQICLKALAKDPADRYASAWEIARDLREAGPAPAPAPARRRPHRSRRSLWSAILAATAALLLLAAVLAWVRLLPGPTPPTADRLAAEWVLDRGGLVDFVAQYPPKITDRSQLPEGPATLRSVKLYKIRPITRDDVERLAQLPGLLNLHLSDTNLTEESLDVIAGMTELRMLWVGWNHLTDGGIARLGNLTNLRLLNLEETQATDVAVEAICAARNMDVLDLGGTHVTDLGIRHVAGLTKLTYLRLNRTRITDACVDDLLKLQSLDKLEVQETDLSPEGIQRLEEGLPFCAVTH